jgi:Zn-dependent M28 family amino/carboxypeptidase
MQIILQHKENTMRQCITLTGYLLLSTMTIISCSSTGLLEFEALQLIDRNVILDDVLVLSSDDMEGRGSATPGELKAADYISDRFKANGLSPINGSYFQPFQMLGSKKISEKSSLVISRQNSELQYESEVNLTYNSTSQKEVVDIKDVPLVFVGYGVVAPEYDWDDFKDADLKDKVLLFLNDDPPVTENGEELFKGDARTYYGRWTYKLEQAVRLGAAGAIIIHTTESAGYPFSVIQYSGSNENFTLDSYDKNSGLDFVAWIDSTNSNIIAQSMGSNLQGLFKLSASRDFKPIDTGYKITTHIESEIQRVQTKNVIGLLSGSDPVLKNQYIVITAHYDHIGKNDELEGDDKIYNGAEDNALGTASLINLAYAFSALQDQPKRSIIFLASAAEEIGLFGSNWFVNNPPVKKNQLVANFNIDGQQIFGMTTDISAVGLEMSTLGNTLKEVARQYKVTNESGEIVDLEVKGDLYPNAGSFYRSDQINFAKAGIPAIYINPGNQYVEKLTIDLDEYWNTHYHQVNDEVNDAWDLSGCERDIRVQFQTVLKVANADGMPRWVEGNEFEIEWIKLHK